MNLAPNQANSTAQAAESVRATPPSGIARSRRERLRAYRTGVVCVGVFRLSGVHVLAHSERRRITESCQMALRDLNNEEVALVANLFLEQTVVGKIKPRGSIGIRYGLDELVGERAVRRIDELAVGRAGANFAARDLLERLHGIQNVTNIRERDAAMVSAEGKAGWNVGRVARGSD